MILQDLNIIVSQTVPTVLFLGYVALTSFCGHHFSRNKFTIYDEGKKEKDVNVLCTVNMVNCTRHKFNFT